MDHNQIRSRTHQASKTPPRSLVGLHPWHLLSNYIFPVDRRNSRLTIISHPLTGPALEKFIFQPESSVVPAWQLPHVWGRSLTLVWSYVCPSLEQQVALEWCVYYYEFQVLDDNLWVACLHWTLLELLAPEARISWYDTNWRWVICYTWLITLLAHKSSFCTVACVFFFFFSRIQTILLDGTCVIRLFLQSLTGRMGWSRDDGNKLWGRFLSILEFLQVTSLGDLCIGEMTGNWFIDFLRTLCCTTVVRYTFYPKKLLWGFEPDFFFFLGQNT